MSTSTDPLCIHCNSALTAKDLSEGWCDSCGKRLPGGPRPVPAAKSATAAPSSGGSLKWALAFGGVVLALLGVAAAFAVAG